MIFICLKFLYSSTITVWISPHPLMDNGIKLSIEQTYKSRKNVVLNEIIQYPAYYTSQSSKISSDTLAPILCSKLEFRIANLSQVRYLQILLKILLPYIIFDKNPEIYLHISDKDNPFNIKNRIDAGVAIKFLNDQNTLLTNSIQQLASSILKDTASQEFTIYINEKKLYPESSKKILALPKESIKIDFNYTGVWETSSSYPLNTIVNILHEEMKFNNNIHGLILEVDGQKKLYEILTEIKPCKYISIIFRTTRLYELLFNEDFLNYIQEKTHFHEIDGEKYIDILIEDYRESSGKYLEMKESILKELFNKNTVILIQNRQVYPFIE